MKKLPDSEFEVMKILWDKNPPLSTNEITESLPKDKTWLPQTVLTLLMRLTEKGFVSTEKRGKERIYFPLIKKADYLSFETKSFIQRYHKNSVVKLINMLCDNDELSDKDIDDLVKLLKDNR